MEGTVKMRFESYRLHSLPPAVTCPAGPGVSPAASEFPLVVGLLADLRIAAAHQLPASPVDPLTPESAAAIDVSADLIRIAAGLGWENDVAAEIARRSLEFAR